MFLIKQATDWEFAPRDEAFEFGACRVVAKLTRAPFMAAFDIGREEVSSANIG